MIIEIASLAICTGEGIASGFVTLGSGEERSADGCTASNRECELTRMHRRAGKAALYAAGSGQTKNAVWNLDSGLEIEQDPCWGMVARVFLPTRPSVNTAVHEPDRQIR
jgi:hypothetical protein